MKKFEPVINAEYEIIPGITVKCIPVKQNECINCFFYFNSDLCYHTACMPGRDRVIDDNKIIMQEI